MKTRLAKKIWCRRPNRLSPYWYNRVWDYIAKINRGHRVDTAKRIIMKYKSKRQ